MSTKRFGTYPGLITQGPDQVDPMMDNGEEWSNLTAAEHWDKRAQAVITFLSSWGDRLPVATPWNLE